ncbi:site-specific integrase [Kiloniella sp. EL199]|uniref:tyrosine-type recombinase/integrase n=1 Tax=Kiloniella sp. EL199 TaxID=2107581 RepID=UPI001C1F7306|nr:site-specific integrase [Kiloniella sp. EL199]
MMKETKSIPLPSGARLPYVARNVHAQTWLGLLANLGRAERTIDAYGRGLNEFLGFCCSRDIIAEDANLDDISLFVRFQRGDTEGGQGARKTVSISTLLQRLTAIRLWYDHLLYQSVVSKNPVPRGGQFKAGKNSSQKIGFNGCLVRKIEQLPRIPTDDIWKQIIYAAISESLRNRVMFALAYFGALRREELVNLSVTDIDYARRLITVRANTTKTGYGRVVTYPVRAGANLAAYMRERHTLDHRPGPLFLSVSNRNYGKKLSKWQWSKAVRNLAVRADQSDFSTHTFRHLRLTHLARAGWRLHEIAIYAGHRNLQSTMAYIHLSGTELASKIARSIEARDEVTDAALFDF